jgi:outer membrane immunogenic protein
MRGVVGCLAVLCLVDIAAAADLDDSVIRGSESYQPEAPSFTRWEGVYGGGQIGYASSSADYTSAAPTLNALALAASPTFSAGLPATFPAFRHQAVQNPSYGFFVGYNSQWGSIILGGELNYNRTSLDTFQADSFPSRAGPVAPNVVTFNSTDYRTQVDATASTHITDYATLRGRAGYVVGNFLPYAMLGFAVGRADINQTATVTATRVLPPNTTLGPFTSTKAGSEFLYGYAAGVGLDVALFDHFFVRGEYEFVQFFPFSGTQAFINTFRLGAGMKF